LREREEQRKKERKKERKKMKHREHGGGGTEFTEKNGGSEGS
jgi:hypothetical protein